MPAEPKAEKDWRYKIGRIKEFDRIRQSKAFNTVYRHADKTWHTPWFVLFYKQSPGYHIGFVASKKVGKAVQRNRAKRLLRALFVSQASNLDSGSYILVAKAPILDIPYQKLHRTFADVLKKSRLLKHS